MRLNSPQINLMTRACMKASRSLIRDFGEIENLQVLAKGPGDFVTSADKRTEKILIDELRKSHPEYGIHGDRGASPRDRGDETGWGNQLVHPNSVHAGGYNSWFSGCSIGGTRPVCR